MPALETLPFDILFGLLEHLSLSDVVRLAKTCLQLYRILEEEILCRRTIELSVPFSLEAKAAAEGTISYRKALCRIHARRSAFARADPFGVDVIGRGLQFLYNEGVVCILNNVSIALHNVYEPYWLPLTFERDCITRCLQDRGYEADFEWQLLCYSNNVLVVGLNAEESGLHLLVTIHLKQAARNEDFLSIEPITTSNDLFARTDGRYLYYGTHSRVGTSGHHEWVLRGLSLTNEHQLPSCNHLQLENFVGSDIGVNVVFKIHDGYFYALSNQTSFVMEEIDWTSFYKVVRFPLDNPTRETLQKSRQIFRRQHEEGPIHDSWTDLSLQVDEKTNRLTIVESRREWHRAGATPVRTFYTTAIEESDFETQEKSEEEGEEDDENDSGATTSVQQYPAGDQFANVLDSSNNAFYGPSEKRDVKQIHPENGRPGDTGRTFMLAKTKFRAYNMSCNAFVDLVEDGNCCGSDLSTPSTCLRLRIGSRDPAPLPLAEDQLMSIRRNHHRGRLEKQIAVAPPPKDHITEGPYRYSYITLWPPVLSVGDQSGAHAAMNPHLARHGNKQYRSYHVQGTSDERSIVYMVLPSRAQCDEERLGYCVVVAFDPNMVHGTNADCTNDADLPSWQRLTVK